MSKSYERRIKGNTVFLSSMTDTERKEYFADQQKKDKHPAVAVKTSRDWGAQPQYRNSRQGGYSVCADGFANNGLIFRR